MRTTFRWICFLLLSSASTRPLAAAESTYTVPMSEWVTLFNGRDFTGWDKFLVTGGKGPIVPNVDPKGVFTVTQSDGESAIHVSGEGYGAITTRAQFTNFHFRVQYKWGPARWGSRAKVGRDSGILYCGIGQPNPSTGWMTSIENNVMEKGVGQWWSVNGAIIDCEGEWDSYEIVARGHDYSERLNGKVVNTWTDTTQRTLRGFIGLQNYHDGKTVRHCNLRVQELL